MRSGYFQLIGTWIEGNFQLIPVDPPEPPDPPDVPSDPYLTLRISAVPHIPPLGVSIDLVLLPTAYIPPASKET